MPSQKKLGLPLMRYLSGGRAIGKEYPFPPLRVWSLAGKGTTIRKSQDCLMRDAND